MSRAVDWRPLAASDPVPGEPLVVQTLARRYGSLAQQVQTQASLVQSVAGRDHWDADAGRAFAGQIDDLAGELARIRDRFETVSGTLFTYARQLSFAQEESDAALRLAADPASLSQAQSRLESAVHARDTAARNARTAIEAQIGGLVRSAAGPLGSSPLSLSFLAGGSGTDGLAVPGWLPGLLRGLGFLPPQGHDVIADLLWGFGLTGTGLGIATDWMSKAVYGRFQARIGNRFGPVGANLSPWERFKYSFNDSSWHAGPYQAAQRARWNTTGEWVGRVGIGLTVASGVWGEWSADSHDSSIDTTNKIGRAATMGVATGAGAWAGAEGGAALGGAIGTAIFPGAGTVVGGAVGGLVGGFAGSEAGTWVGDHAKQYVGGAADWGKKEISGLGHHLGL